MLTLGTQRELTNDMLIKGIIDSVVTVNQFYNMLPFKGIEGNALAYNREESNVDQMSLVGTIDTHGDTTRAGSTGVPAHAANAINKDQQKFTRHSTELTTIIGDAQVNGLIQAVGSDYNDATAVQVAAKAKGIGRTYMNTLVNGSKNAFTSAASGDTVPGGVAITTATTGLLALLSSEITVTSGQATGTTFVGIVRGIPYTAPYATGSGGTDKLTASGAAILNAVRRIEALLESNSTVQNYDGWANFDGMENFVLQSENVLAPSAAISGSVFAPRLDYLDQVIDRVHDKDGMVDYLMMNSAGVRKITQAFRDAGTGFDMMDVKTSSGGVMAVQSYRGVPIFRNDFVEGSGLASLSGASDTGSVVYAGTIDDGSFTHGICGLTAKRSAGMQVQKLGAREDVDADITRVKWYCGLAHFSELGLVRGYMH